MPKYKDYVEEFKVNSKISGKHNYLFYLIKNAKMTDTHFEPSFHKKTENYYTTEPTERISESYITTLPTMQTISPTIGLSYNSQFPSIKNTTTFMPTIKFDNNNNNSNINNNNNNNDLIIGLTVPLSAIVFSLVLFTIYYYKYHLKYKLQKEIKENKERQENKENELDLSFGLSYVDDI